MSIFEDDDDARGTMFYVHAGGLRDFDRYDILSHFLAVARTLKYRIVSPDFRSLSRGNTFDDIRLDVDMAWNETRRRFSHQKVLLAGASSAGLIILDGVARGSFTDCSAILLDSPNVCMRNITFSSESCVTINKGVVPTTVSPDICLYDVVPPVPTFMLASELDRLLPTSQYERSMISTQPDSSKYQTCIDGWTAHGQSIGIDCTRPLRRWLERNLDPPDMWLWNMASVFTSSVLVGTLNRWLPERTCAGYCIAQFADAASRESLAC